MILLMIFTLFFGQIAAQSVICIPDKCLLGTSNTSIALSTSGPNNTTIRVLPGSYTQSTNPELLHSILVDSSAQFAASPGFTGGNVNLPLSVELNPGLAVFDGELYSGSSVFNGTTTKGSMALSPNTWASFSSPQNQTIVFWESIPSFASLPQLSLIDIQSSLCSPPCSSGGTCSSNTCVCKPNFTGASCESCSPNFFGPSCQPCSDQCETCDDGISGSGRCTQTKAPSTAPQNCNCLNGECNSDGSCTCNTGFVKADNGTQCAKCDNGFFENSNGDCKSCSLGCTSCTSSACLTCSSGFTISQTDPTQCVPLPSVTSSGQTCPDGSFAPQNSATCQPCDPACTTCSGPSSSDCTLCASGSYEFNGGCVKADTNGICEGSNGRVADNNKKLCDACGSKCISCEIPNFSVASTISQLQCTSCLAGTFLSNGQCVDSCPSGTFTSNSTSTCTTCDSSCATCSGSSTFCLTCPNGQVASNGKCIQTCPAGTFQSGSTCVECHPDCTTCSGPSFSQCLSCPSSRPVLNSGRCLQTCAKNEFISSTGGCTACDKSCETCSSQGCLSCPSSFVLPNGQCIPAPNPCTPIPELGVCLEQLVTVANTTSSSPPPPGLTDPTPVPTTTSKRLEWWEILLMALGCAFIFLVFLMCCRRRMRKKREKKTKAFATNKRLVPGREGWKWKFVRFGEALFGHRPSRPVERGVEMNDLERGRPRASWSTEKFLGAYDLRSTRSGHSHRSAAPSSHRGSHHHHSPERLPPLDSKRRPEESESSVSGPSLYSQYTGNTRRVPDTKEPLRKHLLDRAPTPTPSSSSSRDRDSLASSYYFSSMTEAEKYKETVRPQLGRTITPMHTGSSKTNSKNPFNFL